MAAKAQAEATVAVTVAAVVVPRVPAAMLARVAAVSKHLAHRRGVVRRAKVGRVPDVDAHPLVTHNRVATKAGLPVAAWVNHALPDRHPVVSPTPCAPASI